MSATHAATAGGKIAEGSLLLAETKCAEMAGAAGGDVWPEGCITTRATHDSERSGVDSHRYPSATKATVKDSLWSLVCDARPALCNPI